MTRFVLISDNHGQTNIKIPDGDVLIHCGDFSARGTMEDVIKMNSWMGKITNVRRKILGVGNHDGFTEKEKTFSKALMTNAELLIDEPFDINGLSCYATPWQPNYKNWSYNVELPLTRYELFCRIPNDTELLLCHCPPFGILDKGFKEDHAGDKMLLKRIRELKKLKYCFFGHLHSSRGIVVQDGITFVNCSVLDDHYKLAHEPIVIDI